MGSLKKYTVMFTDYYEPKLDSPYARVYQGRTRIEAESIEEATAAFSLGQPTADITEIWI